MVTGVTVMNGDYGLAGKNGRHQRSLVYSADAFYWVICTILPGAGEEVVDECAHVGDRYIAVAVGIGCRQADS